MAIKAAAHYSKAAELALLGTPQQTENGLTLYHDGLVGGDRWDPAAMFFQAAAASWTAETKWLAPTTYSDAVELYERALAMRPRMARARYDSFFARGLQQATAKLDASEWPLCEGRVGAAHSTHSTHSVTVRCSVLGGLKL